VEGRRQPQVLAARQERVERGLLERCADCPAHLRALAYDVVAGDGRPAGRRRQQGHEHVHRRRLAGAVRAEEAVDLARLDPQVDTVDGDDVLEPTGETLDDDPFSRSRHERNVAVARYT
jgi:hypothetical protein